MTATKGRPSTFTQETADTICERIAEGESLRSICTDEAMPGKSTVFRWLADDQNAPFRDQYARAREAQADALFDELAETAELALKAESAVEVAARRLVVDTQKWRLSKIVPKKYGDKLAVGGAEDLPPLLIQKIERVIVRPTDKDS